MTFEEGKKSSGYISGKKYSLSMLFSLFTRNIGYWSHEQIEELGKKIPEENRQPVFQELNFPT